jgi:hypothetical protein
MLFPLMAFAVSDESRQLCADIKDALRASNRDLTAVACDIGGPALLARLSNQLNGHEPPTYLWRVLAVMGPEAWTAFLTLRAKRVGREVVSEDIGALVNAVRALVGLKPMARASLAPQAEERVS